MSGKAVLAVAALSFGFAGAAMGCPSFDCRTNHGPAEQAICDNDDLCRMDVRMSELYFTIQNNEWSRRKYNGLKRDQRAWLADRNDCGSRVRCLKGQYSSRISEFEEILAEHGQ
jgi:uncharacterized protein